MRKIGHGKITDYVIAICWTDDVRYFGTPAAEAEYERIVTENLKVELEGESDGFVSIEIKQDLINKTLELKQASYWVKAAARPTSTSTASIPSTPTPTPRSLRPAAHAHIHDLYIRLRIRRMSK